MGVRSAQSTLLWSFTFLFTLRVAGQAILGFEPGFQACFILFSPRISWCLHVPLRAD